MTSMATVVYCSAQVQASMSASLIALGIDEVVSMPGDFVINPLVFVRCCQICSDGMLIENGLCDVLQRRRG